MTAGVISATGRNILPTGDQNGLYLDELQARARKSERRFAWTHLDARGASAERGANGVLGGAEHHGDAGSRPSSRGESKRRGTGAGGVRRPGEFPNPAPKRVRRSEGSSEAQLNGDAMDVDGEGAASGAEAEEEGGQAGSPTNASDNAPEVMERYDSLDVATQTDLFKAAPKTITTTWKLEQPGASVLQSAWNPSARSRFPRALLAVGESLCRYYHVPNATGTEEVS